MDSLRLFVNSPRQVLETPTWRVCAPEPVSSTSQMPPSPVCSQSQMPPSPMCSRGRVRHLSSSHREVRPCQPSIICRNLVTDFLEATSLPVNVPLHRDREAERWVNTTRYMLHAIFLADFIGTTVA